MATATGKPTDGFHDHVRDLPDARADLSTAQLQAEAVAAEMGLHDAELWAQADGIVAALSAEAYRWTAVLTGEPATSAAVLARPVVRTASAHAPFDRSARVPRREARNGAGHSREMGDSAWIMRFGPRGW